MKNLEFGGERNIGIKTRFAALVGCLALANSPSVQAAEAPIEQLAVSHASTATVQSEKPNIFFFLADDMDSSLLKHMPNTRRQIFDKGATFDNYFTNISLCCPARASLFTGKYAHNTGIMSNGYPDGFHGFHVGDEKKNTFAVWLQERGYDTALLGKYLNEYPYVDSKRSKGVSPRFVPNGWTDWVVPVKGQFVGDNYVLNENGSLKQYSRPKDHLSDLMARRAISMIKDNRDDKGLMIKYSYYGPHIPEPASPKERANKALKRNIAKIRYPRTQAFNEADVSDKRSGIRNQKKLSKKDIRDIDRTYRDRILSVKTMDRHIGMLIRSLKKTGQLDNTYIIFTSDNGYHLGDHRMKEGKNSPYDTDISLPLGIRGPGIKPGTTIDEITGNIDIAPTIADMAGARMSSDIDGESLLPLARGEDVEQWREYFFVQRGMLSRYNLSPTTEPGAKGQYEEERRLLGFGAVVSDDARYIEYSNGGRELYDIQRDPYQVDNLLADADLAATARIEQERLRLSLVLRSLKDCAGAEDCRIQG